MADVKIVTRREQYIMVNKKDKEDELVLLQNILKDLKIPDEEVEVWKEEELARRQAIYVQRITETQKILDIING